ncbi:MAG: radical SAM protein, partial [Alphaproteobacteria bacterium]|nr:radical SAM protein [Alphaproteobacteria bacterium]
LELSDNVIISWHGGEPTMVGLDYFKDYMKIVNKYKKDNQNVVNMLQTNATLITDDMAQFFKDNGFIISISLDGDEASHNKNRYNYKGQGSFKDTMAGVEKLRKHGIFPPLIATVTQSTINDGLKNFNFFVNNGFKEIKFSPVYDSDTDEFSINNEEWYNYTSVVQNVGERFV